MERAGLKPAAIATLFSLLLAGGPALAQDCGTLKTISSVTLQPSESRLQELVPVKINGTDKRLLLDTGGYTSQLTQETVDALKLPTGGFLGGMKYIGGSNSAVSSASIAEFQIGSMRAKNVSMLVNSVPGFGKVP